MNYVYLLVTFSISMLILIVLVFSGSSMPVVMLSLTVIFSCVFLLVFLMRLMRNCRLVRNRNAGILVFLGEMKIMGVVVFVLVLFRTQ